MNNILNKYSSENFITINARPSTVCGFEQRERFDLLVNMTTNQAYHAKKLKFLEEINLDLIFILMTCVKLM